MDLFETSIQQLLEARKMVAQEIVKHRKEQMSEPSEELADTSIQDRLPYSISKTVQYLKADEYMRQKKSLKQQKENI